MRTRAQSLLGNGVEQTLSAGSVDRKLRGKVEEAKKEVRAVVKRKVDENLENSPPVIKKHKRGLHRRGHTVDGEETCKDPETPSPKVKANHPSDTLVENGSVEKTDTGVSKVHGTAPHKSPRCTVNMEEMVTTPACSTNSAQPDGTSDVKTNQHVSFEAPRAMRTPLPLAAEVTVPARRSPLPLPPSAVRTPLPQAQAPPAVRSALPVPPAVRSALPLPFVNGQAPPTQTADVWNEDLPEGDEEGLEANEIPDEVDIHGFSSVTRSTSMLEGFSMNEEDVSEDGSSFLFGNHWNGAASETRRRTGPGSRATYRCSRCLAPKRGHKCQYESETENGKEAPPGKAHRVSEDNEMMMDMSRQDDDSASMFEDSSFNKAADREKSRTVVKEFAVSAKWLLETGVLEGHNVRYMPRAGEVLGSGFVQNGAILCTCQQCNGLQAYNASSFEKHVGSTARHPSDFICLENGRCLREVLEDASKFRDKPSLLNALRAAVSMDWDAGCSKCGKSGNLPVRCSADGCLNAYHQACVGISATRSTGWECPDCVPVQERSYRTRSRT